MARLKKLASPGSQALVMKNQLKHTIATGRDKDPAFSTSSRRSWKSCLPRENAGRVSQAQFLEQLELFGQRIRDKDKTGFDHPAHSAVYHYLAALLTEDTARVATIKLFEDKDLSQTMAAGNWKQMPDLHPEIRDLLRRLLMPLAEVGNAPWRTRPSGKLLDILLKN